MQVLLRACPKFCSLVTFAFGPCGQVVRQGHSPGFLLPASSPCILCTQPRPGRPLNPALPHWVLGCPQRKNCAPMVTIPHIPPYFPSSCVLHLFPFFLPLGDCGKTGGICAPHIFRISAHTSHILPFAGQNRIFALLWCMYPIL